MNSKAALCVSLLRGDVISIRTGFKELGITNVPREISRSIENDFQVEVSRTKKEGKSRWGVPCYWFEYRLNRSEHNLPGIELMKEYFKKHINNNPKTDKEAYAYKQAQMLLI